MSGSTRVYPGLPLLVFRYETLKVSWSEEVGLRKHDEGEADVKRVTPNPGRVCSILNQKR